MAEPQPSGIQAGSSVAEANGNSADNPGLKPASKDDAKAAAALDRLDARGPEDVDGEGVGSGGSGGKGVSGLSAADAAKLTSAMNALKVGGSSGGTAVSSASQKQAEINKKKVKVDAKDVILVMEQCGLKKEKATDLLRNHEGDLLKAFAAYVAGAA